MQDLLMNLVDRYIDFFNRISVFSTETYSTKSVEYIISYSALLGNIYP